MIRSSVSRVTRARGGIGAVLALVPFVVLGDAARGESGAPVDVSGGVTVVGQRAAGEDLEPSLTTSLDFRVVVAGTVGRFEAYVEGNTTPARGGVAARIPEVNADAGTALGRDRRGRLQVSELKFDFALRGDRSLTAGLVDLTFYLDTTRIDNDENLQFLAGPFVNNPTIEFPDYTLGLVFRQPSAAGRPRIHAALTSSSGLADSPDRSYSDLLDVDATDKGVFAAIETGWTSKQLLYRVGTWLHDGARPSLDGRSTDRSNFGVWGAASREIGKNSFNLRLGAADPDVSAGDRFASLSYTLDMGRPVLGAGLASTQASRDLAGGEDVTHFEIYLSIRIGKEMFLTPSFQQIWNAGFSGSSVRDRTAVAALRLHKAF